MPPSSAAPSQVDWVQTARFKDGSTDLLKTMPTIEMEPMPESPTELTLEIDTSTTYQKIVGFGGAFTEASAINWKLLSKADQDEVIRLYFAPPEQGGHGYTLGRVPSTRRHRSTAPPLHRATAPPSPGWSAVEAAHAPARTGTHRHAPPRTGTR